ncbi:Uncharacterised protein [Citrobacter freundii]|nr:Uncharacterised protein [Citrobacter freundii]SUX72514.1 Uncharacterised protein [Citrobacter freundii]
MHLSYYKVKEGRSLDRNDILWRESLNALGFDTELSSTAIVPIICAVPKAVGASLVFANSRA